MEDSLPQGAVSGLQESMRVVHRLLAQLIPTVAIYAVRASFRD